MPPFRSIIPWSIMPSGEPMPSISLETGGYRVEEEAPEGREEQEERQCQASLQSREKALLHLCHSTVQH